MDLVHRLFAHGLGTHGATGWHQLLERLRLELHNRLCQHGVYSPCRATEWFGALFDLQAQKLKTFRVHLLPVRPAGLIRIKQRHQVNGYGPKLIGVNNLCKVAVEANLLVLVLAQLDDGAAVILKDDLDVRRIPQHVQHVGGGHEVRYFINGHF